MRIAQVAQVVPFAKVTQGTVIRFFDKDGNLYTGMKVCSSQTQGILFLDSRPPYELYSIFFLIGETHPWDQDVILAFSDATLVSKKYEQLPYNRAPHVGDLTMNNDGMAMLVSKTDGVTQYVDMNTGKVYSPNGRETQPLIVSQWAIVVPRVDTNEALVEFGENPATAE